MQAAPYQLQAPAASGYLQPSAQGSSAGSVAAWHGAEGARQWAPIGVRLAWRKD